MASGNGGSLGRALVDALAAAAGGTVGVLRSFTAKGWHAQISKLTSSPRGYLAAERAGLSVNHRTLVDWLAERREPSKANQARIANAYALMAGRWPAEVETRPIDVTGKIQTGDDVRTRTVRLDQSSDWDWSNIRAKWEDNDVDPDDFEEMFIEDVWEGELGDGSEGWEFPGGSYTVVLG